MNKLDFDTFKDKIGGWEKYLRPILESEEMFELYQEFKKLTTRGVKITPDSKDLFKFLQVCPPENLKVIFIGMDSYPGVYFNSVKQATGIAFDCSNSPDGKCQPSLNSFWDGVFNEYNEKPYYQNNLEFLSDQGVMLTNRALNCKLYKTGSFLGKWDFFWKFFIEEVITPFFPGIIFVLLGKDAEKLKKHIFEMNNPTFVLTHPSFAARNNAAWDTEGIFKKINFILKSNNGEQAQIEWDYKKYLDMAPF